MDGYQEHNRAGKNKHKRGQQKQTTSAGGKLRGSSMHYVPYHTNTECNYIVLSDRAAKAIISETLSHGRDETGGILLGNFNNGIWYVVESIDPGLDTVNHSVNFEYDPVYVNHLAKKLGVLYHHPLTILGVWHRHPGSMDHFSFQDMDSMAHMTNDARIGMISMLVNLDPELRMTFYYCNKAGEVMPVYYDIGDDYFTPEILTYAADETLCSRIGPGNTRIQPHQVFPPEAIGGSIANLRATAAMTVSAQEPAQASPSEPEQPAPDEPAPDPVQEQTQTPPAPEPEQPAAPAAEEQEAVPAPAEEQETATTPAEEPAQPAAESEESEAAPSEIVAGQWIPYVIIPPETEGQSAADIPAATEPEAQESAEPEAATETAATETSSAASAEECLPVPAQDEDSEEKDVPDDNDLPDNWRYINFHNGVECINVVFSDRAYRALTAEVAQWSPLETGGILLGHLHNRIWYVTECIHAGPSALRQLHTFELDLDYVNYQKETLAALYQYPPTILGMWHRHPASLDRFSLTDIASIDSLCKDSAFGILSLLVNLDPELRLTMYHCTRQKEMYKVAVSIGDAYLPVEVLKLRDLETLTFPDGTPLTIRKELVPDPALYPHSLMQSE